LDAKSKSPIITMNIPYGAHLMVKNGQKVEKGQPICTWDPYNAVIISEFTGKIKFTNIIENVTYKEESDEQTGHKEKVIVESRDKTKIPSIIVADSKAKTEKEYNLPVGAHIVVEEGHTIKSGEILVKIPRVVGKTRDITGGLPRVTELFEARNPSNPAVVSEIDGVVSFGKIKRGNREIVVTSKDDQNHKYLIGLSKHVLVQDGDFVRAGTPLSDGAIAPRDILNIKGPFAVQQYLVNGVQEVYRSQGITINNKHIEVIVRQMMRRFLIEDSGDTTFLEGETVERGEFIEQNDIIFDKKFITDPGESNKLKAGQLVSLRQIREENSFLKRNDRKLVAFRDAVPATASPQLMGITKASLGTNSWISAASFQETTKVLSTAAIAAQKDDLSGLKENVIVGKRIPAGTGAREFEQIIVAHKDKSSDLVTQAQFIDME
jgi:DNA-directed RNA polymerase subunit beta'